MTQHRPLDENDREAVCAFLLRSPAMCVVLLGNMERFGIGQGQSPFQGDYCGVWGEDGLAAVGALYNIGAFFFRAVDAASAAGLAECVAATGRAPSYTAGERGQVAGLLEVLSSHFTLSPHLMQSVYMVLEGATAGGRDTGSVRSAGRQDLDAIVRMQMDFELEAFGKRVVDEDSLRSLLAMQVDAGGAVVAEVDGRLVSKAEATIAEPYAGLVGGVYTLPDARGRGHSTACMQVLCDKLLARVPMVGLNVIVENLPARRVYEKNGFRVAEEWLTAEMA